MIDEIKLMLNKIIYDELNLQELEEEFVRIGIKNKDIHNPDNVEIASKYFFLMNDIHVENLTKEEKGIMMKYYEESKMGNSDSKNKLYEFLQNNKLKLLLPNIPLKYIYYGRTDFQHMAPSDAIVLAFHYIKYGEDYNEEQSLRKEIKITEKINYIQEQVGPNKNLKVAILKYNEVTNDLARTL